MFVTIQPHDCTVNGSRVSKTSPAWLGLDLANAELRETSWMMEFVSKGRDVPNDHHLSVPFSFPGDDPSKYEGCRYRVRPIRKRDKFVLVDGLWMLDAYVPKRRRHNR